MRLVLPDGVLGMAGRDADWAAWVDRLPRLAAGLLDDWGLVLDGLPMHGYCALVLPVHAADGLRSIVKVSYPDEESQHEHLALQHWGGRGAARLLRADPHRSAMQLERLHHADLTTIGDLDACEVIAGLYAALHRPALPQLRTVTSYVERWLAALARMPVDAPIPRRMVTQALGLGRDLVADPASTGVIVHGDLHHLNVLAADREPWLAIDPKAMSGDPHYEPAPALWNRWDAVAATGDLRSALRRRFHTLVDVAGLDEDRARDWVVVRMVINAHWTVEDAQREDRPLSAEDREWITRCISIAKAVQD